MTSTGGEVEEDIMMLRCIIIYILFTYLLWGKLLFFIGLLMAKIMIMGRITVIMTRRRRRRSGKRTGRGKGTEGEEG